MNSLTTTQHFSPTKTQNKQYPSGKIPITSLRTNSTGKRKLDQIVTLDTPMLMDVEFYYLFLVYESCKCRHFKT